jgi:hypothetical protein
MADIATGLIAHWKMNDNAANTVLTDNIGSHNGVWQHGTTASDSVAGKINTALNFNRTNNDYAVVTHHADFNISTFTFAAWLNCQDTNLLYNRIISKKINYYDNDGFEIGLWTGTSPNVYIVGSTYSVYPLIDAGVDWTLGGWHHLVVTFEGNTVTVYCDNVAKTPGTIVAAVNNANNITIGTIISEVSTTWKGYMDDVRIYNRVLAVSDIAALWNSGAGTESEGSIEPPIDIFSRVFRA